jgi:hypothetical protein
LHGRRSEIKDHNWKGYESQTGIDSLYLVWITQLDFATRLPPPFCLLIVDASLVESLVFDASLERVVFGGRTDCRATNDRIGVERREKKKKKKKERENI